MRKARAVGINHVALEVGDIEEALKFYGQLFHISLRGRGDSMAFLDLGDQFIALSQSENPSSDEHRHFGLVVDDVEAVKSAARQASVEIMDTSGLDLRDPWGNRWQIVEYRNVQFTKADFVAEALGISQEKTEKAKEELRDKGFLGSS